jgi:DNA-binding response OmpR family regulator
MPRKDGMEALAEIKANASFRRIPIIIFTTSRDEEDIVRSYELGANSYIVKPTTFESLVSLIELLERYWSRIVKLPSPSSIAGQRSEGPGEDFVFSPDE